MFDESSVQPNAGLPELVDGKTRYPLRPEDLATWHERFITEDGINLAGGCCGTGLDHIRDVLLLLGIKAVVGLVGLQDVVDNNAALQTGIGSDLAQRSLQSLADDLGACALIALQLANQLINSRNRVDGSRAAAGNDPERFGTFSARFAAPVEPGEELHTLIWHTDDGALFQTKAGDTVVLDHGEFVRR